MRAEYERTLGFDLDGFQVRALDAIDRGSSVLVAAPTGSGKTVVGEYALYRALGTGEKAFYTTPIKALSNQKFLDFSTRFGAPSVGLLTGDNSIRGESPLVVMTTEVLRNMLYARSPTLDRLRYVVLDEVHYLENAWRGPVWEEVIIHAPQHVQLVCLSATVSNAEEVAAWLGSVRGAATAVIEERRPVPLTNYVAAATPRLRFYKLGGKLPLVRKATTPKRVAMVDALGWRDLLPAIYFIFSRAGCDEAVRTCMREGVDLITDEARAEITAIAEAKTALLSDADKQALGYDAWLTALRCGVAAHHAGHVPPFKEAVELCFAAGLVKVVFATETLALGINMPARSVVIENLSKFTGERHELLTAGEYTQLTGRAGRRGIDTDGSAIVLWSRFVPLERIAALASTRTYELTSAFRPTYNMVANLVRRYSPDEAHRLLHLSFAQFRAPRDRLTGQFDRVLQLLEQWGYLDGWQLSPRGERLASISHEVDLLLVESFDLLVGLDPAAMAAAASLFTFENRSGITGYSPQFDAVDAIAVRLNRDEARLRIPLTRRPDPGFAPLAHAWASGADLADLVGDISPGDFVRNMKQLVDLLRQLGRFDPSFGAAAARLFRGVIAASNLATE